MAEVVWDELYESIKHTYDRDKIQMLLNPYSPHVFNEISIQKRKSLLILATWMKKIEIVKVLLDWGIDPNFYTPKGNCPLYIALRHNDYSLARLLVKKGVIYTHQVSRILNLIKIHCPSQDQGKWHDLLFPRYHALPER
jgi:ankyrin repeat protein